MADANAAARYSPARVIAEPGRVRVRRRVGPRVVRLLHLWHRSGAGIQRAVFPQTRSPVGTLAAFATFGVGFFARPFGGIVFGHFGDRMGRKPMLVMTLLLVGVATFLIGLVPRYEQIGVRARFCSSG